MSIFSISAVITPILAIAAPICVALINNRHQRKMHMFDILVQNNENYFLHIRDAYEKYLAAVGHYVDNLGNSSEYNEAFNVAYMLSNDDVRRNMRSIDEAISSKSTCSYKSAIYSVTQSIQIYLSEFEHLRSGTSLYRYSKRMNIRPR